MCCSVPHPADLLCEIAVLGVTISMMLEVPAPSEFPSLYVAETCRRRSCCTNSVNGDGALDWIPTGSANVNAVPETESGATIAAVGNTGTSILASLEAVDSGCGCEANKNVSV